jgi:energy-coupling factor transporter ATP-binding protein EcfA2
VADPATVLADSPVVPPLVELGRALGWSPLPLAVRDARRAARGLDLAPPTAPERTPGPERLAGRGLTVRHGTTVAVREVDLRLTGGTVTALMGRNGCGKSSLLWAPHGRERYAGSLAVDGTDPAREDARGRRGLAGLVPQVPADLLYLETVAEECEAGDGGTGRCRVLLDRLAPGVPDDTHPRDLSEGQRLALALALVLVDVPGLLLLDEPTRGLDYPGKEQLAAILRELADDGMAVLVATHDVEFVAQAADDLLVMAEGELVSHGPVREVVAQSPAFAPQVTKVLGPPWLTVADVRAAR